MTRSTHTFLIAFSQNFEDVWCHFNKNLWYIQNVELNLDEGWNCSILTSSWPSLLFDDDLASLHTFITFKDSLSNMYLPLVFGHPKMIPPRNKRRLLSKNVPSDLHQFLKVDTHHIPKFDTELYCLRLLQTPLLQFGWHIVKIHLQWQHSDSTELKFWLSIWKGLTRMSCEGEQYSNAPIPISLGIYHTP